MSLVAEFSLPADDFVLGDALQLATVDHVEFDCHIPTRSDVMPYVWVWGREFDEFDAAVETDPAVESVALVDELPDTRLYRAEWRSRVSTLLDAVRESDGLVRKLAGETAWRLEVRFGSHDDVTTFADRCSADGLRLELDRLHSLCDSLDDHCDLTPVQRETLVTAERAGYYNEPSDVTMAELADELDVSLAAVSGRLRRGTSALIRRTLVSTDEPVDAGCERHRS